MWSQVFVCSQCPQGSGADVTLLLACSRATLLIPVSPQYGTWCPSCPGAVPPSQRFHHLGAWPQRPHATPVSLMPADPSVRHCHLSPQCAPTAAPGTCTRCGALPAAWPRPPSACSPPSWCWCWCTSTTWASCTETSRWVAAGLGAGGWGGGSLNPQRGEATSVAVLFQMENILLDERGHLKLTDFGLSRYLQWGERAHTICGTLQYMAPEVLSGGPYSHAADWWSLGVLLFALASGEFPVAPAGDHVAMLERVKQSSYESPPQFSPELARLLAELLCHNPLYRLRYLHHFQGHPFFRGVAFDADLLQKDPVVVAVAPRPPEQPPPDPATFADFDYELAASPDRPWPG
uniref:Ribosomal protein S6 kinase related n=1 Tax=Taeniopygia guttata TaxID=59729 RepID=H0Z6L9_TAEGU